MSANTHSLGKVLQNSNGVLPVDAGISDADAGLEGGGAFGGNFLVALVDVGLDHDTNNGVLALAQLFTNDLGNLGLVPVVLLGVAW